MCGLSGFYQTHHSFDQSDLKAMTDTIAHRGPDSDGFFVDAHVGLGHRRLSVIDLRAVANQPMWSHDQRYCIIFNGEVYNFKEIASSLTVPLKTLGDTEVVLELFAKDGTASVDKLNGMFAHVIYDAQENSLYIFRDRMGIKPLYYYWDGNLFAFASELKSLLKNVSVKKNVFINKEAINLFLHLGYIPQPHSIYQNIYKFPSGSFAVLKNRELKIQSYWNPDEKVKSETLNDFTDAKSQLKKLVESSVRYRMISDVPFGTFLSGGTDSGLVTAVAQSVSSEPVNTFSIGFKESKYNESEYARAVAKYLGTRHHEFEVSYNDAIQLMDSILDSYDEPYADSSAIPTMLVSKLARQHVTMALSGDGGDELFFGYGAYLWAKRLNNPMIRNSRQMLALLFSSMNNRYKRIANLFQFDSTNDLRAHIFSQEQYLFSNGEVQNILKPEFKTEMKIDQEAKLPRKLSSMESQALFDLHYYLKDDLLVKVDRASMKYSLEARVPLLDYRIVEFALNLSPDLKYHHGVMKYLLKELLYDYVPRELFNRPKWGFAIPLQMWLKKELKYLIDDYLSEESVNSSGVVNYPVVNDLKKRFFAGEDYLYNRLWQLIILHKWFLEKKI